MLDSSGKDLWGSLHPASKRPQNKSFLYLALFPSLWSCCLLYRSNLYSGIIKFKRNNESCNTSNGTCSFMVRIRAFPEVWKCVLHGCRTTAQLSLKIRNFSQFLVAVKNETFENIQLKEYVQNVITIQTAGSRITQKQ